MKIDIVPIVETVVEVNSLKKESTELTFIISKSTNVELDKIFAEFLELEVGDGAASTDTIRNYISHTKQYFNWCKDNLLQPLEAEADDIKQYRKFLIESKKKNKTIATKLNILRRLYQAAIVKGLISTNPVDGIKAPVSKEDPASRITFLTEEELALLLKKIQSQLDRAKTQKQKLAIYRDRVLVGIMSLEGCRTIEMHAIKI